MHSVRNWFWDNRVIPDLCRNVNHRSTQWTLWCRSLLCRKISCKDAWKGRKRNVELIVQFYWRYGKVEWKWYSKMVSFYLWNEPLQILYRFLWQQVHKYKKRSFTWAPSVNCRNWAFLKKPILQNKIVCVMEYHTSYFNC